MRLVINLSLFLITLLMQGGNSFSLTDYQINQNCKKDKRKSLCIKILKDKRTNLQKGDLIEIPVIPHRKK